ncbi:MAG: hypothetical protein QW369_07465 [Desulfurococcaceae archaeon]
MLFKQFNGRTSNNLARKLKDMCIRLLRSSDYSISRAEDRVNSLQTLRVWALYNLRGLKLLVLMKFMKIASEFAFSIIVGATAVSRE